MHAIMISLLLHAGAFIEMASNGNTLDTDVRAKRQIMLNGGFMASVLIPRDDFANYPNSSPTSGSMANIYTDPPNNPPSVRAKQGHALFCYG
jgi:hypothetical protein